MLVTTRKAEICQPAPNNDGTMTSEVGPAYPLPRIRNSLICMGIWSYPKLNAFISFRNTRAIP